MKISTVLGTIGKWIAIIVLVGIFALLLSIYLQVTKVNSVDNGDLKEALIQYGNDMNEIREYLFLPQHEYDFFKNDTPVLEANPDQEKDTSNLEGVKKFAQSLAEEKELAKKRGEAKKQLDEMLLEPRLASELKNLELATDKKLIVEEPFTRLKILAGKNPLAQLNLNNLTSEFTVQSILETKILTPSDDETLRDTLIKYLTSNKDQILKMQVQVADQKAALEKLWQEAELQELLKSRSLTLNTTPVETEAGFEYYFTNVEASPLVTLTLNRKTGDFSLKESHYATLDTLKPALMSALSAVNGQTENMKALQTSKKELEAYLKSPEFIKMLTSSGLKIAEPREQDNRTHYDLMYGGLDNEQKLGTISFDNLTGEILFLNEGDQTQMTLEELLSGSKKKF